MQRIKHGCIRPYKVMLCSIKDHANLGWELSQALQEAGVHADAYSFSGYPRSGTGRTVAERIKLEQFSEIAEKYDIIQIMHSGCTGDCTNPGKYFLKTLKSAKSSLSEILMQSKKNIVIFHGGSVYRVNHKKINKIYNKYIGATIVQTLDLCNLGAKNEHWLLPSVDTKIISTLKKDNSGKKLIFAHYPSSAKTKNTSLIKKISKTAQEEFGQRIGFNISDVKVSHFDNLKRISNCDVYIEHLSLNLQGRWYEFGITSVEAAAMGKIVITMSRDKEQYKKEYGLELPFCTVSSEQEFYNILKHLSSLDRGDIKKMQDEHFMWAQAVHSRRSVGLRLAKIYDGVWAREEEK